VAASTATGGAGPRRGSLEVIEGELAGRHILCAAAVHLAAVERHGQPRERLGQNHLGAVVAWLPGAARDRFRARLVPHAHHEVVSEPRIGRPADLGLQRAGEQACPLIDSHRAGERQLDECREPARRAGPVDEPERVAGVEGHARQVGAGAAVLTGGVAYSCRERATAADLLTECRAAL
jgi:hypothetical protein